VGSLRRSTAMGGPGGFLSGSSSNPPRLAQIQEESKYTKARHQQVRRMLLVSLLIALALIGLYHIIMVAVRLSFSIAPTNTRTSLTMNQQNQDLFPAVSLRRNKPGDYYFQSHHSYHEHLQQQHPEHHLSRQERIDQAIQNLKEYQADKDTRDAEFQEEIKAQMEQDLLQRQEEDQLLLQEDPLQLEDYAQQLGDHV